MTEKLKICPNGFHRNGDPECHCHEKISKHVDFPLKGRNEKLSAEIHASYDSLPENIKEFDRVIANYIVMRESERIERIDTRLAYMFANAPETYHAIKQILYSQ